VDWGQPAKRAGQVACWYSTLHGDEEVVVHDLVNGGAALRGQVQVFLSCCERAVTLSKT
jgi:hypothetical protein